MDSPELEAFVRRELNRFRGRLAGFIEAHNLPERTERSIVSTMKSFSYDSENDIVEKIHE